MQTAELGALSDWLLGTGPTSSAAISYQSSKNPEDWLLSHTESKVRDQLRTRSRWQIRSEVIQVQINQCLLWKQLFNLSLSLLLLTSVQTSCPILPSVDFLQAWGQLRDLEAWLFQDQTPVSRERSSSSCSSSFSIEKIDESEFTLTPEEEEEGKLSDWLITPPHVAMETMSDAERWRQVLKPFEDTWSPSEWLVEWSQPVADCSSCCQTTRAMEIENLGQLKCLKTPVTPPEASMTALEAWLQQAVPVPVPQTCRANELCSTYADCVCEDNCGKEALSLWLLQQDGRDKNGVPITNNAPPTMKNTPPTTKTAPPPPYHREQEQKVTVSKHPTLVFVDSCSVYDECSNCCNITVVTVVMTPPPPTCSLFSGSGDPGGLASPHQDQLLFQDPSTEPVPLTLCLGGSWGGEGQQGGAQLQLKASCLLPVPVSFGSRTLGPTREDPESCSRVGGSSQSSWRGGQVAAEEEESGSGDCFLCSL